MRRIPTKPTRISIRLLRGANRSSGKTKGEEAKKKKKKGASAGSWSSLRHRLDPQLSFSQMTNASIGSDLFYPPPLLPVSLPVSMSPDKRKGAAAIWAASRQPGSEARHQDAAEKPESPSQGRVIQERSRSSCSETQRQLTRSLAFSRRLRALSRHGMNRACQSDEAPLNRCRHAAPLNHSSTLRGGSPGRVVLPTAAALTRQAPRLRLAL